MKFRQQKFIWILQNCSMKWIMRLTLDSKSESGKSTESSFEKTKALISCLTPVLLICTWILKFLVWKIKFDELDFLSISTWIFAGYTGSKNQVQTRKKIVHQTWNFILENVTNQVQVNMGYAAQQSSSLPNGNLMHSEAIQTSRRNHDH